MFYVNNSAAESTGVWIIISFVLAIVGSILIYFLFLKSKDKFASKFVNWLRDFLNFDHMLLEMLLKIFYLFATIYITLLSFALIGENFLYFLLYLVFGNLALRIIFEFSLMMIMIWKNTTEINKKTGK